MTSDQVECHGCTHTVPAGVLCACPGAVCTTCCPKLHRDED